MSTKIEWCDETINIYWGCENNCEYCVAQEIAKLRGRLIGEIRKYDEKIIQKMVNFQPVLFPDWENIFEKKAKVKKPKRIFMNMMSDICYWSKNIMWEVLKKIKQYPQHTYIFLTKNPEIYYQYEHYIPVDNVIFGFSASTQEQFDYGNGIFSDASFFLKMVSIEPIHEEIKFNRFYGHWIILGAETGYRKGKIIPNKEWIKPFYNMNTPVFMKDSLIPIVGEENMLREFPDDC